MIKSLYSTLALGMIPGLLLGLSACPANQEQSQEASASAPPLKVIEQPISTPTPLPDKLMVLITHQGKPGTVEMVAEYNSQAQTFASPLMPIENTTDQSGAQLQQDEKTLFAKYLPLNQSYPMYINGREIGQFTNQKIDPPGCGDMSQMTGQFKTELPIKEDTWLAAVAFSPSLALSHPKPPLYEDSKALTAMGENLANAFLKKQSLSLKDMRDQKITALPISQPDGSYKMHIFVTAERPPVGEQVCNNGNFWVLGTWEDDQAQILAGEYKTPGEFPEQSCSSQDLISSFGFRDHLDHILIRNNGYEWWSYSIYAPGENNQWSKVYDGGGGGC